MSENTKEEVFAVGDAVKFKRQNLSAYEVEGLIRLLTLHHLTEPLVVTAVRDYEDPRGRGHKQEITVETIGDNKQMVTTTGFWFKIADYRWIMEMYGQG